MVIIMAKIASVAWNPMDLTGHNNSHAVLVVRLYSRVFTGNFIKSSNT